MRISIGQILTAWKIAKLVWDMSPKLRNSVCKRLEDDSVKAAERARSDELVIKERKIDEC